MKYNVGDTVPDFEMESTDGTNDIMEGVRRCAEFLNKNKTVKKSYSK